MKLLRCVMVSAMCAFLLSTSALLYATDDPGTVKEEISADKAAIQAERAKMEGNAEAAKADEAVLRNDIVAAKQAGDYEKANALKAQLKAVHMANIQERQEDRKDLHDAKKELRQDVRAARTGRGR
ncbi:MAG: hypothetical protein PHX20_04415 [Candidatus Omnitrophica bacterium]|nr:hypothetical protein [Candidatus Omnitrophota bacterium]